jgi:DNA-binding NarL/FixJ family response regulator
MGLSLQPSAELAPAPLWRLTAIGQKLHRCSTIGQLLAEGADATRTECGFTRGVILGICGAEFTGVDTDALCDRASDRLRREALTSDLAIVPGSLEERLIAAPECASAAPADRRSTLAAQLGLEQFILYPIVLEDHAVAMLLVDRTAPEVMPAERALVSCYAMLVAVNLDRILLRERAKEVASELRQLTALSDALMRQALEQPISLPSMCIGGAKISHLLAPGNVRGSSSASTFTAQELRVANLLSRGLSNPEIASELVLGVETVKSHVTRIFQKLGVSNRAQAAAVLVTMPHDTGSAPQPGDGISHSWG